MAWIIRFCISFESDAVGIFEFFFFNAVKAGFLRWGPGLCVCVCVWLLLPAMEIKGHLRVQNGQPR